MSDQHTLWTFKFTNRTTGQEEYTQPTPLNELLEVVSNLKIPGQFCLCVIIPDFYANVEVKLNVDESKLFKGDAPSLDFDRIISEGKKNVRTNSEVSPRRRGRPPKKKEESVEPLRDPVDGEPGPTGVTVRPAE